MNTESTGLQFKELGTQPFSIETPAKHIKLHCVLLAVAKRGSGKSFFISNLLHWLDFSRISIISPTFESNYQQFKSLGVKGQDIFDPDDPQTPQAIIDLVNGERDDLLEYRQKLKIYNEVKKLYKHPNNLEDDLAIFSEYVDPITGKWTPPYHEWGGKRPKLALFVDDAQSTCIFRSRKFLNMVTRHRHLGSMPGDEPSIGLSIFIAVQNYTATGGGLPKAIRGNATHLALWKTKNERELKLISEELSGEVSPERFLELYNYAMDQGGDYAMLFVDLHPKIEHPSQFRMNYTDFIINK